MTQVVLCALLSTRYSCTKIYPSIIQSCINPGSWTHEGGTRTLTHAVLPTIPQSSCIHPQTLNRIYFTTPTSKAHCFTYMNQCVFVVRDLKLVWGWILTLPYSLPVDLGPVNISLPSPLQRVVDKHGAGRDHICYREHFWMLFEDDASCMHWSFYVIGTVDQYSRWSFWRWEEQTEVLIVSWQ